jgi:cytochrome oxidase Cu insertion factor (SCO1/SenC/PrrC family)
MSKKEYGFFVIISLLLTSITPFIHTAHAKDPGELAPEFTLTDIDGNTFSLSDYQGTVVLLDFFYIGCPGCEEWVPHLRQFYGAYGDKLVIISISVRPETDTVSVLNQYRSDNGMSWTITSCTADVSNNYGLQYVPTLFLIDKEGYIRYKKIGYEPGEASVFAEEIEELMKSSSSVSCNLGSTSIDIGSSVIIHGEIHPPRLAQVKIEVSKDDGITWSDLTSVTSASDGNYSYGWTPDTAGLYQIKASWPGDAEYTGATSPTISLTVVGLSSQISCQLSTTKVIQILVYGSVTISGSITPAIPDVTITIYYIVDEATWNTLVMVNTDREGRYSYTWTPKSLGTYHIRAVWPGDATYEGAVSATASVIVEDYTWFLIIPTIVVGVVATYLFETRKAYKKKKKKKIT